MALSPPSQDYRTGLSLLLILISLATTNLVEGCRAVSFSDTEAGKWCRKHGAVLTDFGGVGDGKTSNTKAFRTAIDSLKKYSATGGAELYVPPGKWLTGSFSLISNFTLYLDKDAVLLASQDESEWPVLPPLPSYGKGRDAPAGRYASLITGTNLTDVVITVNSKWQCANAQESGPVEIVCHGPIRSFSPCSPKYLQSKM